MPMLAMGEWEHDYYYKPKTKLPKRRKTKTTGSQCFAYNCFNYSFSTDSKNKNISFHRFPNKQKDFSRWNFWWQVSRRQSEPTANSLMCSDHFYPCHIDYTGQTRRLREGAIPSEELVSIPDSPPEQAPPNSRKRRKVLKKNDVQTSSPLMSPVLKATAISLSSSATEDAQVADTLRTENLEKDNSKMSTRSSAKLEIKDSKTSESTHTLTRKQTQPRKSYHLRGRQAEGNSIQFTDQQTNEEEDSEISSQSQSEMSSVNAVQSENTELQNETVQIDADKTDAVCKEIPVRFNLREHSYNASLANSVKKVETKNAYLERRLEALTKRYRRQQLTIIKLRTRLAECNCHSITS